MRVLRLFAGCDIERRAAAAVIAGLVREGVTFEARTDDEGYISITFTGGF
jgi:predicted transcriptional regulator